MSEHSATPEELAELELREARQLELAEPPGPGLPARIASASGLVRRGDFVYVIGDELLGVGVFELTAERPGRLRKVLEGELPAGEKERSEVKPDLEALTSLPPYEDQPWGGLLGLGSGSGEGRDRGFHWAFAADGSLAGEPETIDLAPAYEVLAERLGGRLNVEGAAVFAERLWLFHRANEGDTANAVAEFALADLARTLSGDRRLDPGELRALRTYDLGSIEGTPLCFSDATTLTEGLVCFTASAEDEETDAIRGSVVGTLDGEGQVRRLRAIDRRWKVEGVDASVGAGVISLLFVCDQDDPDAPAPLLSATMPLDARFDR